MTINEHTNTELVKEKSKKLLMLMNKKYKEEKHNRQENREQNTKRFQFTNDTSSFRYFLNRINRI